MPSNIIEDQIIKDHQSIVFPLAASGSHAAASDDTFDLSMRWLGCCYVNCLNYFDWIGLGWIKPSLTYAQVQPDCNPHYRTVRWASKMKPREPTCTKSGRNATRADLGNRNNSFPRPSRSTWWVRRRAGRPSDPLWHGTPRFVSVNSLCPSICFKK